MKVYPKEPSDVKKAAEEGKREEETQTNSLLK